MKGDLLIRHLWTQGNHIVYNMGFVDTDAASYHYKSPEKCVETTEKSNKKKYIDVFLKQRQKYTLFVVSVDGLFGVKA